MALAATATSVHSAEPPAKQAAAGPRRLAPIRAKGIPDLRPPLKWAGGKRWLAPHLRPFWRENSDRRLVEPFCGGIAIALAFRPDRVLLNDINPHAINFYRWLKAGLQIERPMANDRVLYYEARDEFNRLIAADQLTTREAAELFYFLNHTGYNGLCRFNRDGLYNVPFGSYKSISYLREFPSYQAAFHHWEFSIGDFADVKLEPSDFVYADPPYDVDFRQYSMQGFPWEDQVRLAKWLVGHPGPVVLSNQATARVVELYGDLGFELQFLDGPRRISCDGNRAPAHEVLAYRNAQADHR